VIEARYHTDLAFRALGRVIARDVNVGDFVRAGQRLAAIDATSFEAALRSAEASDVAAQAQAANAEATRVRQETLLEQHSTTQAAYDAAKQATDAAVAAAKQADAAVAKAREQLGYAELVSETDGVVTAVNAEVGQTLAQGATAVSIARPDVREAVVDLGEDALIGLSPGAAFTVRLQGDPTVAADGLIREIAPDADPVTRTRRVRIAIDAPPPAFRLGSTIDATPRAAKDPQIWAPASALLEQDGKTYVWLIVAAPKGGESPGPYLATRAAVTVAERLGDRVHIVSGVMPGQRIAVAGAHSLAEGMAVALDAGARP